MNNSTSNTSQSSASSSNPTTTTNVTDLYPFLNLPDPNESLTYKQRRAKKKREMTAHKNKCFKKYIKVNMLFQLISNVNFSFTI